MAIASEDVESRISPDIYLPDRQPLSTLLRKGKHILLQEE